MPAVTETGDLYSSPVAFVYVFNLIIGAGALTMPKAFAGAGWIVSTVLICVLCGMSFITSTFMVEAMAAANALLVVQRREKKEYDGLVSQSVTQSSNVAEVEPLLNSYKVDMKENNLYDIKVRVEMGQMAKLFYNKWGLKLFYLCLVVYLYGDLAIYAAAVPKSLTQISCGTLYSHVNQTNGTSDELAPCWGTLSTGNVYRIYLLIFSLALGPFSFFNVQKTKYLQYLTTLLRWKAFIMMIVLATMLIAEQKQTTTHAPVAADLSGVPSLFGVCVYSFMCQHSLPSLITPVRNKSRLTLLFVSDFTIILIFYAVLSFTAMFAFGDLKDLYTLNFVIYSNAYVRYFLALFPVFTLSTNFPIISVTLRDNLKNLFYREGRPYPWVIDRLVFPLVAILPPILVAFITQNLEFLVGVTGSYAGAGVQYLIPASLVYCGRKKLRTLLGCYDNKHRSLLRHRTWLFFVYAWTFICVALVTVYHIISKK
ncbi:transmembrane protein 104 [Nematostella vectensis]|uniref:transmembrane protein 104 n=1 Tax=Nematostella vectensis TaxID=45351 RepID=UPI00138FA78C|nr:transmembrane protein 104 [Nematostella vectensis]